MSKNDVPVVNVPNALTVLRLALVPVFIWVTLDMNVSRWWPFLVFALAAGTDKLDGYLARKYDLITDFGKLADSIADKALISAALILLSWQGLLWWWVTVLLIAREIGITVMRMVMVKVEVMAAGHAGKLKMALQSFGIAGLLIPWAYLSPIEMVPTLAHGICWVMIGLALFYSLYSAWEYVDHAIKVSREYHKRDSGSAEGK